MGGRDKPGHDVERSVTYAAVCSVATAARMGALIARVMVAVASIAALWRLIQRPGAGLTGRVCWEWRVWFGRQVWPVRLMKVLWIVDE
jgi:hypothetical protein